MENLSERAGKLRHTVAEYSKLLEGNLSDPTTIYLGDNYFASMPIEEARTFLTRKIESLNTEIAAVDQLTGVGEDGLPIFDIVEELDDDDNVLNSKVSRAGWGTMSDNDNAPKDDRARQPVKDAKEPIDGSHKPVGQVDGADPSEVRDNATTVSPTMAAAEASVVGEYEHIESSPAAEDQEVQYIEDVGDSHDLAEDTSQGEYRDIDPSDVLELELLGDSDDGNIDFDFDHIEEDDDDDDDDDLHHGAMRPSDESDESDDDHVWQRASLFPHDEATRKLIEAHLALQNQQRTSEAAPSQPPSSPKRAASNTHVHFSETVDVREFETTPAERKGVIYDRPSRFKIVRNNSRTKAPGAGADAVSPAPSAPTTRARSAAAAAAAAAGAAAGAATNHTAVPSHRPSSMFVTSSSPVHGAVRERSGPSSVTVSSPVGRRPAMVTPALQSPPKASKVLSRPQPQSVAKSAVHGAPAAKRAPEGGVKELVKHEPEASQHGKHVRLSNSHGKHEHTLDGQRKAEPSSTGYDHPEHTVKELGKASQSPRRAPSAYAPAPPIASQQGASSPTISRKDRIAQQSNAYFADSFIPDVDFLKLHDKESAPESAEPIEHAGAAERKAKPSPEDDRPVVSAIVKEREPNPGGDKSNDIDDFNDSSEDNTPDMREIKHEYQRLRQQLIYESGGYKKTDSEKAVEPIEMDGTPKKVSRFKAARVAS